MLSTHLVDFFDPEVYAHGHVAHHRAFHQIYAIFVYSGDGSSYESGDFLGDQRDCENDACVAGPLDFRISFLLDTNVVLTCVFICGLVLIALGCGDPQSGPFVVMKVDRDQRRHDLAEDCDSMSPVTICVELLCSLIELSSLRHP